MGSMHTGLEDREKDFEKWTCYLEERARGGVGLIVTGGFAPNRTGWLVPFSGKLTSQKEMELHQKMVARVHQAGAAILLQILHAGRYSYHPLAVSPSGLKAPISPFKPWKMSNFCILGTIQDFVRCAELAQQAGYDGVEIMGSEGYLINQFLAEKTNRRKDSWGGGSSQRSKFAIEIVRQIRKKVGDQFLLMFRLSLLDLVEKGSSPAEALELAQKLEMEGIHIINTGIGWHEARVPTIATRVPRAAYVWITRELKRKVKIPVVAVNRINTPEVAERILADNNADLISMARPFLADPEFANKAKEGRSNEINTCIACNQGCLDHIFARKRATCLVNPRACYETEFPLKRASTSRVIAVVGAGPAGLSFAVTAAQLGHQIILLDQSTEIGGQFNLARRIPGKEEFVETLRYYSTQLKLLNIDVRLGVQVTATLFEDLRNHKGDSVESVVIATGVKPRPVHFEGCQDPRVVSYLEVLLGSVEVGKRVAIIGAGGIGFDIAEFLLHSSFKKEAWSADSISEFFQQWGVDNTLDQPGALVAKRKNLPHRKIFLMQRKKGKLGSGLGKTTGWIHRTSLLDGGVEMLDEVQYQKLDQKGFHILRRGKQKILEVDHVVVCAGQESEKSLYIQLKEQGKSVHLIGGAAEAGELDAKRAIYQGMVLAYAMIPNSFNS